MFPMIMPTNQRDPLEEETISSGVSEEKIQM
jgi:hypothetical protein